MAGNANSGRRQEKPFADALRMEIAAAGEDHRRLRRIAAALLDKAESGDMQAIKELADRTDGKAIQQVDHGSDPDRPVHHVIERRIVDTNE